MLRGFARWIWGRRPKAAPAAKENAPSPPRRRPGVVKKQQSQPRERALAPRSSRIASHFYMLEDLPSLHLPSELYAHEGYVKVGHASCDQRCIDAGRTVWLGGGEMARIKECLRSRPFAVLTLMTLVHDTRVRSAVTNPGAFFESAFERPFHRRFAESPLKCRYDNRSGCEVYTRKDLAALDQAAREVAEERGFTLRVDSHLLDVPAAYLIIMRRGSSHFLPDSLPAHIVKGADDINPDLLGDFLCHCARLEVPEMHRLLEDERIRGIFAARRALYYNNGSAGLPRPDGGIRGPGGAGAEST